MGRMKRWLAGKWGDAVVAAFVSIAWGIGLFIGTSHAAGVYSDAQVKAAFLFRFAGYIEWPAEALNEPGFTIAVLGGEGVAAELKRLLPNYTVKDRPAMLKKIDDIKQLGGAEMLYVGDGYKGDLRKLIGSVSRQPVLVVTDDARGLDAGSTVNFLLVDRRVRFEVSLAAAERSGLKISSELLSVAARVHGAGLRSDVHCNPCVPRMVRVREHNTVPGRQMHRQC